MFYLFNKVLGAIDVAWGLANQGFEYFGKLLSHTIGDNLARKIKESIFIRVNNPTLKNNIGKFNLPHIWDSILLNTKGLNLKRQVNNNSTQSN